MPFRVKLILFAPPPSDTDIKRRFQIVRPPALNPLGLNCLGLTPVDALCSEPHGFSPSTVDPLSPLLSFSHPALTFFPSVAPGALKQSALEFCVLFFLSFARLQGCITFLCSFTGDKQSCGGAFDRKQAPWTSSQRQRSRKGKNLFNSNLFCFQVFLWFVFCGSQSKHFSVCAVRNYESETFVAQKPQIYNITPVNPHTQFIFVDILHHVSG